MDNMVLHSDSHGAVSDASRVETLLRKVCDQRDNNVFIIFGRAHSVEHGGPGESSLETVFSSREDGGWVANIVLSRSDEPAQQVHLAFTLAKSRTDSRCWLTAEFNPTTILAGNNLYPATIADSETGELYDWSSSVPKVLKRMLRLGFEILEQFHQHSNLGAALFSINARQVIECGDIHVVRAQWASYLPTPDVPRFLQLMTIINAQTIAQGSGVIKLATHLGFEFEYFTDPEGNEVTGVLHIKRHGKKPVYSATFYNKVRRVAQMRQGKTLTRAELDTVHGHVRFDITAHSEGVLALVAAARQNLKRLMKRDPHAFTNNRWLEEFQNGDAQPTVWWLERAIFVLSHFFDDQALVRRSFGKWLIPHVLNKILRLKIIASFTSEAYHKLGQLDDRVAAAWRSIETPEAENWADELAAISGRSKATVHNRRNKWLEEFNIDISLPHAFYRDLLFFGPNSLTSPEARSALTASVRDGDGEASIQILQEAAKDFDRQRRKIVGATVNSLPHIMPVKASVAPPLKSLATQGSGGQVRRLPVGDRRQQTLGDSRKRRLLP